MTVYIYSGYGSSYMDAHILEFMFSMALHPHGIPIKRLTDDDLNNHATKWQRDAKLLVFGGGEFTKVKEKLTTYGRQSILDFASHHSYLGICKGAYAGAAQIRFLSESGNKESDGFGFFNGIARGSLPLTPKLYTGRSDSAHVAAFHHEIHDIDFPALYWGGPYFDIPEDNPQNVEKLVTLKSMSSDTPLTMGIKVPVGDHGQAVLLGFHSEANPHYIRKWVLEFSSAKADMERIEREMSKFDLWKYYIGFACMLDDLKLVPGHSFLQQILRPGNPRQDPSFPVNMPRPSRGK